MKTPFLLHLAAALSCAVFSSSTLAQGTAFTYQGSLDDNDSPANGLYDLRFGIYDAETNGVALGVITNTATAVTEGVFTVTLDFGAAVFDGGDRWLEIGAVTNGGGAFTTLSPRQPITSVPYAIRALNSGSAEVLSGTVNASQLTGTISSNNIAAGSITSALLADGAVGTDQLADAAVTADKISTTFLLESLPGFVLGNDDNFGSAVASMGPNSMVVGAPGQNEVGSPDAGEAYLFSTDGTLLATFLNPTPETSDEFGSAVAGVGEGAALVGAPLDNTGASDAGAAYLFSGNGTLLMTFFNPSPSTFDQFGSALAGVAPDTVLIGAWGDNTVSNNAGSAYLFGTNGVLRHTYTNPVPRAGDFFGRAVAAAGSDHVVIGADGVDAGADDAGAAYLFSTNGALVATYTNPTPQDDDKFGAAVAGVGSDKVLVGAWGDNTGGDNAGTAYLFDLAGTLLTTITNPAPEANDFFGRALAAVSSDTLLVGAFGDNTGASDAGAAYLFGTDGTLITIYTNPTPAFFDEFGRAVAGVGTRKVIIGAPEDDQTIARIDTGVAHLFTLGAFAPGIIAEGVAPSSISSSEIAAGAITSDKVGSLDATSVTSGTLDDARLSINVALLDATQTFTGNNVFNDASGSFTGDGSGLAALNASQLTTGTVPSGRVAGTYSSAVSFNNAANTFAGNGSGLTALNASALSSGTVGSARISGSYNNSVTMGNSANVFSGTFRGNATAPATAPSFTWVGDTDSGLYRSGANTVALATGGAERMRITSSGDVGIGTTAPEGDLHVRGGSSLGSLIVTPGVSDSDAQLLLTENTSASIGGILRYDGSANQVQILGWSSDVATAPHVVVGRDNGNLGLGTGANSVDARLHVQANNARAAKFDRYDTDGQLVAWARNDSIVGDVTVLAGNVTYNAFTGSHYAWCDEEPEPGTLMRLTGRNDALLPTGTGEVVYGVEPASGANDPACLGTFMGTTSISDDPNAPSIRLVSAVGNGEMWVVDTGTNIRPGDLLISSATRGCARVDDPTEFAVGHVIARAAEVVDWNTVQAGEDGIKQAKISVLYGPFTRGSQATLAHTDFGGSQPGGAVPFQRDSEITELREENRELRERLAAIEEVLGGTRLALISSSADKEGAR